MLAPISILPDSSRIWIFASDRKLSSTESQELLSMVDAYLADWAAHKVPVQAGRELKYDQFVIIAANPEVTAPSGCSIDDLTRMIKTLSAKFGADFFGAMKVFYRDGETVRIVPRSEFKRLAESGAVTPETAVFDNSITSLALLRAGKWELPASESWHAALMPGVMA